MSIAQVRNAVRNLFGAVPSMQVLTYAPNDLYEAYLLTLVIEAARAEGATTSLCNRDGSLAPQAVFRRSPGFLHSHGPFTHILIEFSDREPLEAHVGISVKGVSRQVHECDVAVLRKSECDRSRQSNGVVPRSRSMVLAIEAKYYSSYLPLYLGRGFLGLNSELWGVPCAIATNIESEDVVTLVLHHNVQADDEVLPLTGNDDRVIGFIRNIFHKYKH